MRITILFLVLLWSCNSDKEDNNPDSGELEIIYVFAGEISLLELGDKTSIPLDEPIEVRFEQSLDVSLLEQAVSLKTDDEEVELSFELKNDEKLLVITPSKLIENTQYTLNITNELKGREGESFSGLTIPFTTLTLPLEITSLLIDDKSVNHNTRIVDIGFSPQITVQFSLPVNSEDILSHLSFKQGSSNIDHTLSQIDESTIQLQANGELKDYALHKMSISSNFATFLGRPFEGLDLVFYTKLDSTPVFPEISDEELLTKIQEQTFKYFWDFGHPVSGLARERNSSGETVTSGGSGFGVMSIIVGIERGFITRQEGVDRIETIVDFLLNDADRFHGVWSHWLNGSTGSVVPFSSKDDGGDLVETAFMIQGLLTVRQYLEANNTQEASIIDNINTIWESVEWDWYTQGGQNVLYWHWSPNFGWEMNHKIQGWNEALIVYVLAASSPTHSIEKEVYEEGWARNGGMVNSNGNRFYDYTLPLRSDMGGPLFFSHYSFLGLDPRNLEDQYANYWTQNVTHSQLNHAYCAENPQNYVGYKAYSWGLTASDGYDGYSAHSPNNDRGVITPTAAISSIPYTPDASLEAIRHFYYILGDRLWGEYGFYDAFNLTADWTASSYLAIDQGPIIVMIENYRTGLLWDLFMSAPEIQNGLQKLNFTYE